MTHRRDEWTSCSSTCASLLQSSLSAPFCHIPKEGNMKFGSSVLFCVLAAAGSYSCDAFTIPQPQSVTPPVSSSTKSSILVPSSNGLILPSSEAKQGRTNPFLSMVAGGAERAYGDDYYEGAFECMSFLLFFGWIIISLDFYVFRIQVYELDPHRIYRPFYYITVLFTSACRWCPPSPS